MENYSNIFFKKSIYDLCEDDIIHFFNIEQEESSILEFKSGGVKLEKVYREVSALHNSQGGLLIIGSPIPKKDSSGKETFHGDLTRSPFRSKDWLYQKLSNNISPPPINVKIHDVICKDGGKIQILDIPKSINPPHQDLSNGVYFIRYETETKFASHGLVEALFNRRKQPFIEIESQHIVSNDDRDRSKTYVFNPRILNVVDVPVLNIKYIVEFHNVFRAKKEGKNLEKLEEKVDFNSFLDRDSVGLNNNSLVKGLSIHLDYIIEHISEPFLAGIYAWGDNMNLQRNYLIISPFDNRQRKINNIEGGSINLVIDGLTDIIENSSDKEIDIKGFKSLLLKLKKYIK
jgi:Schlafen, AlbA_2